MLSGIHRLIAPLRHRNFRLFWFGQTISAFGDPLQTIALAWLVLNMTGSAIVLGSALLAITLPRTIMTLLGGIIADYFSLRSVIFWCDALRAIIIGGLALLAFLGMLHLFILYILLVIYGVLSGIFYPITYSTIPKLIKTEEVQAANSLSQMTVQLATVVAAPLGGILVALVGPSGAIAINAVSFAIASLATLALDPLDRPFHQSTNLALLRSAYDGFIYVISQFWLVALLLMDTVVSFAIIGSLTIGLPFLAHGKLAAGSQGYGLLLAGFGVGSIVGMLFLGFISLRHRGLLFCLLTLSQAPLLASLAFVSLPLAVTFLAGIGLLNGVCSVMYLTLIQTKVAGDMLGRVMSLMSLATFGVAPLSQMVTAIAIQGTSPEVLFASASVLMALSALGGLIVPTLRTLM